MTMQYVHAEQLVLQCACAGAVLLVTKSTPHMPAQTEHACSESSITHKAARALRRTCETTRLPTYSRSEFVETSERASVPPTIE
jgi:hypothetical protein